MPRKLQKYLEGNNIYICKTCGAHLAKLSDLISTHYQGASGKAYLINQIVNVRKHDQINEEMNSGKYKISRISCIGCDTQRENQQKANSAPIIGWIYNKSYNSDNLWKEGKYILEVKFISRQNWIERPQD